MPRYLFLDLQKKSFIKMNKIDFEYSQLGDLYLTPYQALPICLYKNLKPNELIVYRLHLLYQKKGWRSSSSSYSRLSGLSRNTILKNNNILCDEGYITSSNKIDKSVKKMMEEAYKNDLVYSPQFVWQRYLGEEITLSPSEAAVLDIILYLFEKKECCLYASNLKTYLKLSERSIIDIVHNLKGRNLICGQRGFFPNVTEIRNLNLKLCAIAKEKKEKKESKK